MTGPEVYDEILELFKDHFVPGLKKLVLISKLIPEDESDEAPGIIKDLQQSLKSSGEAGMWLILDDLLGEVESFCIMVDALKVKIDREEKVASPA